MTLYEFNELTDQDQMQCWMQQGRYLMTRYADCFAVNLYAVDSFFVEVWYDPGANQIERLRGFSSVLALEKYFDHIWLEWQ